MSKTTIFRCPPSAYFPVGFAQQEKAQLTRNLELEWVHAPHLAEIFISNTHTDFAQLQKENTFANTRLILHPNSGFDQIPYSFVENFSGEILLGNTIRAAAVSDYILRCLMHSLGSSPFVGHWDQSRQWARQLPKGKIMRIVGHGHVGQQVALWAKALGMIVDIDDPYLGFVPTQRLDKIDVLVLACGLNRQSKNMLGQTMLSQLSNEIIIINGARGELIDLDQLCSFLHKFKLAKAYLDVFPEEPYQLDRFATLPNLMPSCHVAGVFEELASATIHFEQKMIEAYLRLDKQEFQMQTTNFRLKNRPDHDFLLH